MNILFRYLKVHWPLVILALVLAAINQVFSMLDPFFMGKVIDQYLTKYDQFSKEEFLWGAGKYLLAIIGVAFVSRIAKNFQDYYVNVITQKIGAQIYCDGLAHSLELPYQIFENQRSGTTLTVLQKVRTDVEKLINSMVNVLFVALVGISFVSVYAIRVHWIIMPMYLATVPLLGSVVFFLGGKIKKIQKRLIAQSTELAGSTVESLRNIELIKSLGLSGQEIQRLNDTTGKILDLELEKVKFLRMLSFTQGTMVNLLRTGIMFGLLFLVFDGSISPGQFMTLIFYSFAIFNPLQELGNVISIYRESQTSLENFARIMESPKEPVPANALILNKIERIEFKSVGFRYEGARQEAVEEFDFSLSKGETVAFVGPSGSGKSTLIKLLVGLYLPHSGQIFYNGKSFEEISKEHIRAQLGLVTQDTHLFAGTIRENLLFVNPKASDAQLWEMLEKASCQNLMERATNGLDTYIGEGGVKVSGGEKQRLAIARALLRRPKMLIFDEATSALDSLTEVEINKTIQTISSAKEHLVVMVAHRLSTIMHADRIYVMEHGKVAEMGSHGQLLEMKGLYSAMWRQQIGERRLNGIAV
jgi:ATP-binding cassette subfamily B protein